mgnify:FL=1
MTRIPDNPARAYFSAYARDLTPDAMKGVARLLYVPVIDDPEVTLHCSLLLSRQEQERASRFALPADEALFIQRRAFRRYCGAVAIESTQPLSTIEFVKTENGRPWLADQPGLWFSFSSCRFGFVGAWSANHDLGVDIEDVTRNPGYIDLAKQYFSPSEAKMVEKANAREGKLRFFRFWCLKEAALKCTGQGLPFGLDAFQFGLSPVPQVVKTPGVCGGPERFKAFVTGEPDRCIGLVVRPRF